MKMHFETHLLKFTFDAGTSRGIMKTRPVLILKLSSHSGVTGIGEAAPIDGLSVETFEETRQWLEEANKSLQWQDDELRLGSRAWIEKYVPERLRALRTAFEMGYAQLQNAGAYWFEGPFLKGQPIPINGLIWMDQPAQMLAEAKKKWEAGFDCLKLKIGALDFDSELEVLFQMRKMADPGSLIIRVDANGAFDRADVFEKLKELKKYHLHSIEQPIKPGQWDLMEELCQQNLIPVALDEELIHSRDPFETLKKIKPGFIVLKPSLIGGFEITTHWIKTAENMGIGWWLTSALESNYGLQALAQYVSRFEIKMHQGLGTGKLYENNIGPESTVGKGQLTIGRVHG